MKRSTVAVLVLLLSGCQSASLEKPDPQPEPAQPAIPTLTGSALQDFIVGKALRYNYYGAVSTFRTDGTYQYHDYEVRDHGTYAIAGDEVCITFDDGGRRCDQYALIGQDYFRIEQGGRQTKVDGIKPA